MSTQATSFILARTLIAYRHDNLRTIFISFGEELGVIVKKAILAESYHFMIGINCLIPHIIVERCTAEDAQRSSTRDTIGFGRINGQNFCSSLQVFYNGLDNGSSICLRCVSLAHALWSCDKRHIVVGHGEIEIHQRSYHLNLCRILLFRGIIKTGASDIGNKRIASLDSFIVGNPPLFYETRRTGVYSVGDIPTVHPSRPVEAASIICHTVHVEWSAAVPFALIGSIVVEEWILHGIVDSGQTLIGIVSRLPEVTRRRSRQ